MNQQIDPETTDVAGLVEEYTSCRVCKNLMICKVAQGVLDLALWQIIISSSYDELRNDILDRIALQCEFFEEYPDE